MGQIGAVEIADRQFAEDIVEDRGGILDRVIALHHARRFEPGEGEGFDKLFQRHAVLQAHGNGDCKVVHHGAEARTFLVHVDEDLAQPPVAIFAGAQIHLVAADDGLLGIALATFRQLFAVGADDLLDDHLFHDLFGQHGGLFLHGTRGEDFFGFLVIFDQRGRERLAELGAIAIKRVGLDPQRVREFVGRQRFLDRGRVRHVDRLGNRARDERLRRRHHVNVGVYRQIARALLAAGVGAVEHIVMFGLEERRAFQRHRAANMVIGGVDLGLGKAQVAQKVEGRVVQLFGRDAKGLGAELFAQRPLVEHKADVEGRGECRLDLLQLARAKAVADQRRRVDAGAIADGAVADGIGDDFSSLARGIAELFQGGRNRLVDDLEVTTPGQFLELHQREVRLDAGGVAIHHQTDGAGRGNHRGLGVAVAVLFAKRQRLVPGRTGQGHQALIGAIGSIQRNGVDVDPFIAGLAPSRGTVVADHAQHVLLVALIAREGAKLGRHLGRGGIGHTGHDRGQGAAQRAALGRIVAQTHIHQEAADVGIAQTQRAEVIGQLCNFLRRELRHHHRDFQGDGPEPRGVDIGLGVELAVSVEGQKVHRRQVAGGVVQEHVLRTGVRATDRAIFRAGVPGVDRIVELDARVSTSPGGVADLIPQVTRLDGLGHLAIGAANERPVGIVLHGLQEGVGHPHRVVRILARDGDIGLGIPVHVIGREFDRGIALLGVLQDAIGVGVGDHGLFGRLDRRLQGRVFRRIHRILGRAIPLADRGEDLVQTQLMRLGTGNKAGHLLLFDDLPVDEILDIGVVHVGDDHLGRAPRGAARLDRARRAVADLQEPHQARGLAAARKLFAFAAQGGEVGAGARAVFEQPRLTHPQVHDAAIAHQIILDRLDKAGMRLGVFIGRGRFGQHAGLVIDVVMTLAWAVDAIGPMQASVEPLGRVRRSHLAGKHEAHLVVIGLGIGLGREIAALPAPIGPSARQAVEHLLGAGFANQTLFGRQFGQRLFIGDRAPQELRHALFLDALQNRRNARLAEILLRQNVRGNLAPACGHFDRLVAEHHLAIGIANLRRGQLKRHFAVSPGCRRGEFPLDLHAPSPSLNGGVFPPASCDRSISLRPNPAPVPHSPVHRILVCFGSRHWGTGTCGDLTPWTTMGGGPVGGFVKMS